ncbi:MAG: alpha/beta fold hydrolase [Deltaproteobacteria bacterium]|nr:alpha/beta fold hydrolase [Deltaproteobacteria bacterium]
MTDSKVSVRSIVVTGGGRRFRVHAFGRADSERPALLALHGFTGSGLDMEVTAPWLLRPVLAPDLPGHGETPADPDDRGPAFDRVVAELNGLAGAGALWDPAPAPERLPLLGYSMGGRVALGMALEAPQRFSALILVSASPGIAEAPARLVRAQADEALAQHVLRVGARQFATEWAAQPLIRTQARVAAPYGEAMSARRAANDPRGLAASLRGVGTGRMPPLHQRLAELSLPVLLVTGGDDARYASEAEAMARALPAAMHVWIPGAGHAPHLEAPQATADAVEAFLEATGH